MDVDSTSTDTRRRTRSNGEGAVWEGRGDKSGRWFGSVTTGYVDGRQIRKSVTGATKREVLAKVDKIRAATANGVDLPREDLTVGRFLEQWLADVLPGTVRNATMQQYSDVVRLYLIPTVGQKRIRTLAPRA